MYEGLRVGRLGAPEAEATRAHRGGLEREQARARGNVRPAWYAEVSSGRRRMQQPAHESDEQPHLVRVGVGVGVRVWARIQVRERVRVRDRVKLS